MATRENKTYTLAEMKDEFIGKTDSQERDEYEYKLRIEISEKMTEASLKEHDLSRLGKLTGVKIAN